ncbi:response regulator [Metabacillus mangrovi]|nr:response regulator [Metabacillus mangrovi]
MYTLFIADDEKIVIEGLTTDVPWEAFGIAICGTASDGKSALAEINRLKPDLVLADIRMPGMTGLELIGKAKKSNPDLVFIMISGYSEFEYARRALELEAVDYLVKPMEAEDIVRSVRKAIEKLEKKRMERSLSSRLEKYENELAEKHVLHLLLGRRNADAEAKEVLTQPFAAAVLLMKDGFRSHEALMVHVREQLRHCYLFTVEASIVLVSLQPEELRSCLQRVLDLFPGSAGLSSIHHEARNLPVAYEEAKEALKIAVFGSLGLTEYEELGQYGLHKGTRMIREIEQFFLSGGSLKEMDGMMERTLDYARKHKLSPQKSKVLCFALIKHFLEHMEKEYELEDKMFGEGYLLYETVESLQTLDELERWMRATVREALEYLDNNRISFNEKLIHELKQYLHEHFSEPIVLEELGRHFYKSPAYLCSLFSKNAGKTIFEYITALRMDHAKKLLRSSNLKISEICEKAGYSNHKYFNQVFKKNTGKTPGQYRSEHVVKLHSE